MTIDEVNARFAIIGVGNRMVVMDNAPDGSIEELWSYEEFKKRLVKEFIRVNTPRGIKILPLADVWLESPRGRSYEKLVYAVPGSNVVAGPRDYNGWQGFAVKPAPGDWSLNRAHILEVICNGNVQHFEWVLNWIAALVQYPGRHAWTAIVLRGGQGTGKGHFANNMIGALFGPQQYLHILGAGQLTAEFNEHLSGKVYIFADESTWGGDPKAASKLKGLITEDMVPIHRKFLKMVEERSMLHTCISSNSEWPIPIEHDDRRFTVFEVSSAKRQDDVYFAALRAELANGGLAAMLYDMQMYKIVDRALRTPLITDAKSRVTTLSLKLIEHWWLELLETGVIENGEWPPHLTKRQLHDHYIAFLDRHHKSSRERRSTETEMGIFLKRFTPITQQMHVNGRMERVIHLPPLAECRATWVSTFKWPADYKWDDGQIWTPPENAGEAWEPPVLASDDPGF